MPEEKMPEEKMDDKTLDQLLDTQGVEAFPGALSDRIMANLPDQNREAAPPFAQILAFGGSIAASIAIGISLGLSDIGQDFEYAEDDMMALAFNLPSTNDGNGEAEEEEF